MSTAKPQRRWFAFSLRSLFVVLTIFACWLGWQIRIVRQRRTSVEWIYQHGGRVNTFDAHHPIYFATGKFADRDPEHRQRAFPAVRRLFGDEPIKSIDFFLGGPAIGKDDKARIEGIFPEAIVSLDVFEID